jgi:hypothetical protein
MKKQLLLDMFLAAQIFMDTSFNETLINHMECQNFSDLAFGPGFGLSQGSFGALGEIHSDENG